MPLTPEQHQHILASIASGRLRLDAPRKMYAGYGDGRECEGCKQVIDPKQVEYEAIYENGQALRLHLACAGLWDAERRRQEQSAAVAEDARRTRSESQATQQHAREAGKHSQQLHDEADVLIREAEEAHQRARDVKRGHTPGSGGAAA